MDQLVKKDSQGPDVQLKVVDIVLEHFRRHVLVCSTESGSFSHVFELITLFMESPSEVTDLDCVTTIVLCKYEEILRLEISVDDSITVQIVEAFNSLHKCKGCMLLTPLFIFEKVKQVSFLGIV